MKKTLFLVIFTLFCIGNIQALHAVYEDIPNDPNVVEYMPEFPGGTGELMTYLMKNLVYPQECNAVPGFGMRVIVRVVVEKDGSLSDITVLKHKDSNKETPENRAALDKAREAARNEAIRVVKSMPKWTPAKHKGKAVRCYYTMPVTFRTK